MLTAARLPAALIASMCVKASAFISLNSGGSLEGLSIRRSSFGGGNAGFWATVGEFLKDLESRFDEVIKKFYNSGTNKKNEESFSIKLQTTLVYIIMEALKP